MILKNKSAAQSHYLLTNLPADEGSFYLSKNFIKMDEFNSGQSAMKVSL